MANRQLVAEAFARLGFENLGEIHYGIWNGYAVTHYLNQNYECVHLSVRTDKKDNQLRKNLLAAVKERFPKRFKGCMNLGDSVAFNLTFDNKQPIQEQLVAYLNGMTETVRAAGIRPAQTCAHCGAQAPDSLCIVGNKYQPVHASCVRNAQETTIERAQQNEESGSYLTGTIGALIGTIVGIIPTVLTVMFTERIYALLFALVPLAAMFGYRLFKGKQSKASIGIIIVLSIIGVFILQLAVATITVAQEYGLGIGETAGEVIPYFLSGEGIGDLLSNSVMEFVFMAIGIAISWRYLNQTNSTAVAAANAVAGTLRPINVPVQQPAEPAFERDPGADFRP